MLSVDIQVVSRGSSLIVRMRVFDGPKAVFGPWLREILQLTGTKSALPDMSEP